MAKHYNQGYKGSGQNSKKEDIERLKDMATKNKVKTEEVRKQELIDTMGEEDAKLFMSQEEVLHREKDAATREEELKKQAENIQKTENELKLRTEKFDEDEKYLLSRIKTVNDQQLAIDSKSKSIEKKETELMKTERSLISRENNAENEFALQNQKALEVLRKRQEELQVSIAKIEEEKVLREAKMEREIAVIKSKKTELVDEEAKLYYENRKKEIDAKLAQIEKAGKDQADYESKMLTEQREALEKAQKSGNKMKIEVEEKKRQLDDLQEDIRFQTRMLDEDKKTNQRVINDSVDKQVEGIKTDLKSAKQAVEHYKNQLAACEKKIEDYEKIERESNGNTIEDLLSIKESLEEDVDRLKKERATLPNETLFQQYKSKAMAYDSLQGDLEDTRNELFDLQNEKQQWMKTTNQLEIERENCKYLEKRREALEATIVKYGEEVNRFKSLYEQPKELAARLDAIKKPILERKQLAQLDFSETQWLNKIYDDCLESGIKFNKRLLYSFHTALKTADWSPLTVLAGVSGTGKSLLPEYYCRYGGLYFMSMAVQPDWDSPQALFGYFNSVDNRFNATTLLRAMVQFSNADDEMIKDTNLSDTMFLVLLDEMNLAHVELYFSDMLSKLERRRNTNGGVCVEIDLGAGMDKYQLELNGNVLWVGTMNEDETTKSLSDKVLDRGNLLSFPRPKEFISRTKTISFDEAPKLSKSVWNSWTEASVIENPEFNKMIEKYKKGLEEVNEAMEFAGRALGHRVWQSIENYMANHPHVIAAFNDDEIDTKGCDRTLTEAFEEALVHKVMPKLRGIETDGKTKIKCIDKIRDIMFGANGIAPGLREDFENAVNTAYETFLWNSAKYLEDAQ